jgi:microcystin-dependent protein
MQSNITTQAMYFRSFASASAGPWVPLNPPKDTNPVGTIIMYGANPATGSWPAGYLRCDGGAYSRPIANGGTVDTYAALYAVIGTAYGSGDGSTTFNAPDFNAGSTARVPMWATPGTTGGAATHFHTTVAHSHTVGSHSHTLSAAGKALVAIQGSTPGITMARTNTTSYNNTHQIATVGGGSTYTTATTVAAQLDGTTDGSTVFNTGGAVPNTDPTSTIQPYLGVIMFIKY